jgi:hypothetical protein
VVTMQVEPEVGSAAGHVGEVVPSVTVTAVEVAAQPSELVVVTEYIPAVETVIDCVVWPDDHAYPDAALAVSMTVLPGQIVVDPLVVIIGSASAGYAVTVVGSEVAWQPSAFVVVTLYSLAESTVMASVVAPVDQS